MSKLILIVLGFCICACGKRVYTLVHEGELEAVHDYVLVDESYHCYVRYVYAGTDERGQNIMKSGKEYDADRKLIEVEYLLASEQYGNVIYITTIPDKYQKRYMTTSPVLKYPDWMNAYDFNTFHMGKVVNGEFVFEEFTGGGAEHWIVDNSGNSITLQRIDSWVNGRRQEALFVSDALRTPIEFEEMPDKRIVLSTYGVDPCCELSDPRLFMARDGAKYGVYFKFACPPPAVQTKHRDGAGQQIIYFNRKRMRYSPVQLFHKP